MKCAYCGNEIPSGEEVTGDGHSFCNTIHRYSWKRSGALSSAGPAGAIPSAQPSLTAQRKNTNGFVRKIIGTIIYSAASYFILIVILGALAGGAAGCEAGQNGQDPAEAGRIAGEQFASTYGLFILMLCFILSAIGSVKGFLPLTKSPNT